MADDREAAALVAGFAARRLDDHGTWSGETLAARLASSLSPGVPQAGAAAWLEGFLGDAAHILVHDDVLLPLVDDWLYNLDETALMEALPLLRRATTSFGLSERQRLLRTVAGELRRAVVTDVPESSAAFEAGAPLLDLILGLGGPS